ncbi:MAG: NAD(P)H-dependent glycerol-3-phosphate dehydrogenase [Spirochaetaceae bacterium]
MKSKRIGMIGAGAWGTAAAKVLAENGHEVVMWAFEEEVVESINRDHENRRYLMGVTLPESIRAVEDIREAAREKEFLLIALPSLFLIDNVKQLVTVPSVLEGTAYIGVLTKGFIPGAERPLPVLEAIERYLPGSYKDNMVYLSGPSHAEEVARNKLTGLISASKNPKNSIRFRELLSGSSLMVFSSLDVMGVQTSAALKNVIAIAFGILDALKELDGRFGDNTESLLLAAGLNEIQQVGTALGSTHPETFTSIAGVGDLDVTCRSVYGRNRRFGREIILNRVLEPFENLEDLLGNISSLGYLPEGAAACSHASLLSRRYRLKTPIIDTVYRILNRENEPDLALDSLLKNLAGSSTQAVGEAYR